MPSLLMGKTRRKSVKSDIFTITKPKKSPEEPSNKSTFKSLLKTHFQNYCDNTSLHGVCYITKRGLSRWERRFWAVIVGSSILAAIALVWVNWMESSKNKTVTVLETTFHQTSSVDFPAITLCNFNKISRKKSMELAKTLKKPSSLNETELADLFKLTIFYNFGLPKNQSDLKILDDILKDNKMTWEGLVTSIQPNCLDMTLRCYWKGSDSRCDGLFQTINSSEGNCCSFNYFGLEGNNFPVKLKYTIPKQPYRVTGCGFQTGLTVLLDPLLDDYFGSFFDSIGFRILIHDSFDYPDENAETKMLSSGRETFLRITPERTFSTDNIRDLDGRHRRCKFANEVKLRKMKRYSYINCMAECRSKIVFERCGCVPITTPNSGPYPICNNLEQITCFMESRDVFMGALPGLNWSVLNEAQNKEASDQCGCLADCDLNQYQSEITMGAVNSKYVQETKIGRGLVIKDQIILHVYYGQLMCSRYRHDVHNTWLSFLASTGGLLGLVLGFSFLTGFELLYLLLIRTVAVFIKMIFSRNKTNALT